MTRSLPQGTVYPTTIITGSYTSPENQSIRSANARTMEVPVPSLDIGGGRR